MASAQRGRVSTATSASSSSSSYVVSPSSSGSVSASPTPTKDTGSVSEPTGRASNSTSIIADDSRDSQGPIKGGSTDTVSPTDGNDTSSDEFSTTNVDGDDLTFHHAFQTLSADSDAEGKANITASDDTEDISLTSSPSTSASSTSDGSKDRVDMSTTSETAIIIVNGATNSASQRVSVGGGSTVQSAGGPTIVDSHTTSGITYEVSSVVSIFQMTLPNGGVVTTSATYLSRVPVPTAETNGSDDSGRGQYNPPGPVEITPGPSTGFFQKPAAATGVFVVVAIVIGCLIWMWTLIRRHRRQSAIDAKKKRPSYAYGATGFTPGNRGSFFAYDTPQWPQHFPRDAEDLSPPVQLRSTFPSGTPEVSSFPSSATAADASNDLLPPNFLVARRPSLRDQGTSRTTSPPVPPRSPFRVASPPSNGQASVFIASGDLENGARVQSFTSFSEFYSPPSTSQPPLSRSDSFGRQLKLQDPNQFPPYSYPTKLTTIYDAVEPPTPKEETQMLQSSSRSSPSLSSPTAFRSSAYVVPSPTPSNELFVTHERLSNPFSDAESPPRPSVALHYVREAGDAVHATVLERGVSLRRNNTLRDKPEQGLTPHPSTAECGSSGSDGANSGIYPILSKDTSRGRPRKSESISTAETSLGNTSNRIGSPDSSELFYNPAFASPIRTANPPFPEAGR